ncbi:MAG: NUDIX hydrolase [Anaerolineaceae bacterium]|nr:NUDIX hydrolase [Anaerolineaceae bacterium]
MAEALNQYASLFSRTTLHIPGMKAQFERRTTQPPAALISNVNCVPFVGDFCVVITLERGSLELPGGTCEPGESCEETLRRELLEEAGAQTLRFEPLGAWSTHSSQPHPFRPHLPHPDAYRYVVYADVALVTHPTNHGEQVAQVEVLPVHAAADRFRASGRPEFAELYELADAVRRQQASRMQVDHIQFSTYESD